MASFRPEALEGVVYWCVSCRDSYAHTFNEQWRKEEDMRPRSGGAFRFKGESCIGALVK